VSPDQLPCLHAEAWGTPPISNILGDPKREGSASG
jgi:hypothetical protein